MIIRTIQLVLLFLSVTTLTFAQGNKVYHEGKENEITSELSELEDLKAELTSSQRDFSTAKELMREYGNLSFRALESGNIEYINEAIKSLKEAKEMAEVGYEKWKAYHALNNTWKSPTFELEFKDLIRVINEALSKERIEDLKMTCCGPDIVELHLVTQNVVEQEIHTKNEHENTDFWIHGEISTGVALVSVDGKQFNLNNYEINLFATTLRVVVNTGSLKHTTRFDISFFKKNENIDRKLNVILVDQQRDYDLYNPNEDLNIGECSIETKPGESVFVDNYKTFLNTYHWKLRGKGKHIGKINSKDEFHDYIIKNLSSYNYDRVYIPTFEDKYKPHTLNNSVEFLWEEKDIIGTNHFKDTRLERFLSRFRPDLEINSEQVVNELNSIIIALEQGIIFNPENEIIKICISDSDYNKKEITSIFARLIQYSLYVESEYQNK